MATDGDPRPTAGGMIDVTTEDPNETTGPHEAGQDDRANPGRRTVAGPGVRAARSADPGRGRRLPAGPGSRAGTYCRHAGPARTTDRLRMAILSCGHPGLAA